MLHVQLKNFRKLRDFELLDPGKLSIVVGYNESGKTTLVNSIKFAATGEAFGHKGKATKNLVSHGEERMSTTVRIGDLQFHRTVTSGDTLKHVASRLGVDTAHLPLMFDSKLCGDGGNKHMKAFLNHMGEGKFNPAAHFADDARVYPRIEAALRAGKVEARAIIKYCEEQRAASKEPPSPTMPGVKEVQADDIAKIEADLEVAQQNLAAAAMAQNSAKKFSRNLIQIATFIKDREAYTKTVEENSYEDPLAGRREHLEAVCNINITTFDAIRELMIKAGFDKDSEPVYQAQVAVRGAIRMAKKTLDNHPRPLTMPEVPVLPAEAQALWDEVNQKVEVTFEFLNSLARKALERESKANEDVEQARRIKEDLAAKLSQGNQSLGAWDAYRKISDSYESRVIQAKEEWDAWNYAAKAIAAAEEEHVQQTSNQFAKIVTEFSRQVLQGREVRIDRDEGIFLGPVPISECSESTQWRIELAVMAAVNLALKSPILIIDGADILDVRNRTAVTQFLMERVVPRFQHTLLTMTSMYELQHEPPLQREGTDGINKWILDDGKATLLEKT